MNNNLDDEIIALIEYKNNKMTQKTEHIAKTIFKFNRIEISPIPKEQSIEVFRKIANGISENQLSLFE